VIMWRKRASARRPHPDPARELELQRILDLRASIARRAELIAQYRREIKHLHAEARADGSTKRIEIFLKEAAVLDRRIADTEDAIGRTGEEITKLQEKIPADDLAFL